MAASSGLTRELSSTDRISSPHSSSDSSWCRNRISVRPATVWEPAEVTGKRMVRQSLSAAGMSLSIRSSCAQPADK